MKLSLAVQFLRALALAVGGKGRLLLELEFSVDPEVTVRVKRVEVVR